MKHPNDVVHEILDQLIAQDEANEMEKALRNWTNGNRKEAAVWVLSQRPSIMLRFGSFLRNNEQEIFIKMVELLEKR